MTTTNYPNGVSSFGIPVLGGLGGIPFTGNYYFVDAVNGADGNEGSADSPMQTLTAAYARTVSGNNDVIFIVGDGGTTGTQRLSATLTWANNATHLIGITAPTMISQRARISTPTSATVNINPLMTVSGSGCLFANFSFFQGVGQASTDEKLINITGDRNYFWNVQFGGMGHANGAARAGSYVLALTDGDENTFERCTIGLDTVARTAANASVIMRTQCQRNIFLDCLFPMYATASTPIFVDTNATTSMDRFNMLKGCTFQNSIVSGTGTAVASVVAAAADQGGSVILDNCSAFGASEWSNLSNSATVLVTGSVPNGNTSGIGVNANPS